MAKGIFIVGIYLIIVIILSNVNLNDLIINTSSAILLFCTTMVCTALIVCMILWGIRLQLENLKESQERKDWYYDSFPEERKPLTKYESTRNKVVCVLCNILRIKTHWYAGHGYEKQNKEVL